MSEKPSTDSNGNKYDKDIMYYGSAKGKIYSWVSGENQLNIYELLDGYLITCSYSTDLYDKIHKATKKRNGIVIVEGDIVMDRNSKQITKIKVHKINLAPEYQDGDLEKFIGCVPNITDGMSSVEFIEHTRGEG